MSSQAAIEALGLRTSYKDVEALRGVDLGVEAGTVLGLVGPTAPARRPPFAS
jgi:ABC-2 type transport system ATP-binding protein